VEGTIEYRIGNNNISLTIYPKIGINPVSIFQQKLEKPKTENAQ
jgi:hypothetical protein